MKFDLNLMTEADQWHTELFDWNGKSKTRKKEYTLRDLLTYYCYYLGEAFADDFNPYLDNDFFNKLRLLVERFGLDTILFAVDDVTSGGKSIAYLTPYDIQRAVPSAQDYLYTISH